MSYYRKCESSQIFVKNTVTHCIDSCKSVTMCGEVEVPEKHLDVCRTCNSTGHECKENPIAGEAGEGAFEYLYLMSRHFIYMLFFYGCWWFLNGCP